ncbi:MAG TPA: hypothetical protein VFZ27_05490 [Terriglobia bacterium]|nr:hypothetical protein [Terriglobia bacterium]
MIRHAMAAGILILLSAAVCAAADINGRWEGSVSGPNGDFHLVFNFHADGSKLTGTVETPNGENPISDGKVSGDHLPFKTHFNDNDVDHEGTIRGNIIDLKVSGPWGENAVTLKRASEKKTP